MNYHELAYWNKQYKAGNFGGLESTYEWLTPTDSQTHANGPLIQLIDHHIKRLVKEVYKSNCSGVTGDKKLPLQALHIGCGNSEFGVLVQDKLKCIKVVNVDYSSVVINQMKKLYPGPIKNEETDDIEASSESLSQSQSDSTTYQQPNLSDSGSQIKKEQLLKPIKDSNQGTTTFPFIFEKGLLDALLCEPNQKTKLQTVTALFNELFIRMGCLRFVVFTLDGDRLEQLVLKEIMEKEGNLDGVIRFGERKECYIECKDSSSTDSVNIQKWACSLLVFDAVGLNSTDKEISDTGRDGTMSKGIHCKRCLSKNIPSIIRKNSRCLRCGVLDRSGTVKASNGKS